MELSLEHMDYILGFEAEPPAVFERKAAREDGASGQPMSRSDHSQKACQLSGKRVHKDTTNERSKKRRATTEEKVQKFLDTGAWNALLPKHESALSEEVSSRVASAAAGLGLPSPHGHADADADADTKPDNTTESEIPARLSKPVYKSIDNLLCLAVATPIRCAQHGTHKCVEPPAPQNTSLLAPKTTTPPISAETAPKPPDASPTVSPLQTPSRSLPTGQAVLKATTTSNAAHLSAAPGPSTVVPIEMGIPTMWRSHSGTQLSCY